ncbi:hypothetical protein FoTM2_006226 [Fusarium oxysporum f. sp. vasinfectum]|nr:hypothetical protein FoTM2_006226 [Fusarium oxysporum f. sp. vasinfectum]
MWHRLAALKSLSEALNTADPAAFLGIAVFAFFEVVSDGVFGEWDCHLRGARSLLDCHCSNSEEFQRFSRRFTGLEEIVAYFAWWDTIGALVRQSTSNTKSGLIFDDWHRSSLGQDFFDRVGCPAETFWLFVSLVQSKESTNLSESLTRAMAQLLKLGMDKTEKGKCSDIYRCAAVIAVLTTQSSSNGSEETSSEVTLEFAVDRICHIIESACSRSRYYPHMATPAYLAGMRATNSVQCKILGTYWRNCEMGDIPRYSGVQMQCEERWRKKGLI